MGAGGAQRSPFGPLWTVRGWGLIFLEFKRFVSAHYYSYRAHLLTQASYDPELHFGKVWARSVGNEGRLRRFYVLVGLRFRWGSEEAGTPFKGL